MIRWPCSIAGSTVCSTTSSGGQLPGPFGVDGFAPQIALSETEKEVRVTAGLPGLDEKYVEVTLTDSVLTLKGEKTEEHEEEKGDYYHAERCYGWCHWLLPHSS